MLTIVEIKNNKVLHSWMNSFRDVSEAIENAETHAKRNPGMVDCYSIENKDGLIVDKFIPKIEGK